LEFHQPYNEIAYYRLKQTDFDDRNLENCNGKVVEKSKYHF